MMDCHEVAEQHLADRYVLNQLTAEEAERFEDHYMSCDTCLDAIERAELMARGFKRMGAEQVAVAGTLAAGVAWWRRQQVWRSALLAASVMVVAVPLWLQLGPTTSNGVAIQANTPVVYLQPERSADLAPSRQLRLPESPGPIVLVLELDPPLYESYRAEVWRDGQQALTVDGLELDERRSLTLSLDSRQLAAGDYLVQLEGSNAEGQGGAVGRFALRVLGD